MAARGKVPRIQGFLHETMLSIRREAGKLVYHFNDIFRRTPLPACGHPLPAMRGEGSERGSL